MTETTAAGAAVLSPVRRADRFDSLDLVRGFAVLGILAVNAMVFFWPHTVSTVPSTQPGWDAEAASGWLVMDVFFKDKMRTLFSMLFGVSIFLVGGDRSDPDRARLLRSRLFWLALFGLVHGAAFWFGDILLLYALTGFIVLLMRGWGPRKLLMVGIPLYLMMCLLFEGMFVGMQQMPADQLEAAMAQQGAATSPEQLAEMIAAMRGDAVSVTLHQFGLWAQTAPFIVLGFIPMTISLMLIGMGLFKAGFLAGRSPAWVYLLSVLVAGGCLWLIWGESNGILASGFDFFPTMMRPYATFLVPLVSLGYASVLILLLKFGLKALLHPLISAGRMAFTNYLTQTLIMTTIAYGGRGLGYYGEIGWPEMWQLIGAVWIVQLIWSPIWLHFFRMGPIEWIWRSLTYRRLLPLRREATA